MDIREGDTIVFFADEAEAVEINKPSPPVINAVMNKITTSPHGMYKKTLLNNNILSGTASTPVTPSLIQYATTTSLFNQSTQVYTSSTSAPWAKSQLKASLQDYRPKDGICRRKVIAIDQDGTCSVRLSKTYIWKVKAEFIKKVISKPASCKQISVFSNLTKEVYHIKKSFLLTQEMKDFMEAVIKASDKNICFSLKS